MKSNAARAWVLILLLALAAYGGFSLRRALTRNEPPPPASTPVSYGYEVGDFTLTERSGREFHARELQGEIWVASFFFSNCHQACITLNNHIARLLQTDFKDAPVRFVSISVDPKNDTPQVLSAYAEKYVNQYGLDPQRWLFLTTADGSKQPIQEVSQQFRIAFAQLLHSDRLILVDRQGRVQGTYQSSFDVEVELLKKKIDELLAADAKATGGAAAKSPVGAAAQTESRSPAAKDGP